MLHDLKTRSLKGLVWATGESVGVALISLVSFVILARLLSPEDFGIMALATVFITFSLLLTAHSFADAVVQRPALEADHLDTAFWSTLAIALALMAACLAGADMAAAALDAPPLADVLRWLSPVLPLGALSSVQIALFRREMRFDAVARRSLLGRGLGAAVGIGMAFAGYGYWALVGQQLVGQVATTAAFAVGPWRPRLRFSGRRFREMWAFGAQVSLCQVLGGAGEQTLILLVGTVFGTTALGYFTLAWRAVQLIRSLISSAVYQVGLSAFSKLQHDRAAMADAFVNATRLACLVGFPVAVGIVMIDRPLVLAAFDDKWQTSIPLLAVLALELIPAFYGMFLAALYRATDHAGWGLATTVIFVAVGLGGALAAAPFGLYAVTSVWVARTSLLVPLQHAFLAVRLLAVPADRLLAPLAAPAGASVAMAGGLVLLRLALPADLASAAELALLVPVGALIYVGAIRLLSPPLMGLALRTAGLVMTPARR
ncbi:lipopolysaccharide biosynthesis protein [Shumkonia mesophila]|uniref:lipopolysaccharide biosynthesis protein n=1 Tax=Shumkonia mesophila TaxID=2838854 RepID=UPI002935297E|nr:lipopolysaccharide biosynthesis protein [Shumkonia mesophila]